MKKILVSMLFLAGTTLLTAACDRGGDVRQLQGQAVPKEGPAPDMALPDASRFGMGADPMAPAAAAPEVAPALSWTTPEGWTQIASTQFRDPNFKIGEQAEAYVSLLPGRAGGALSNVNRWRAQMNLAPLGDADLAQLETIDVMGQPAMLIDWTGTFTGGMGQGGPQEGWRMVGLIAEQPGSLLTVKLTGPADVAAGELDHFKAFCASLKLDAAPDGAAAALPAGHPPISGMGAGAAGLPPSAMTGAPADVSWTVPAGWQAGSDKPMRLATFVPDGSPQIDISVIALSGDAGGTVANIQRWYGQVGQAAPTAEAIEQLPKIEVLGQPTPLVEAHGDFSGMGRDAVAEAGLMGVVCPMGDRTLFVKMTGPADQVQAQREAFVAFCASLQSK